MSICVCIYLYAKSSGSFSVDKKKTLANRPETERIDEPSAAAALALYTRLARDELLLLKYLRISREAAAQQRGRDQSRG